jgi:hypothetical protein
VRRDGGVVVDLTVEVVPAAAQAGEVAGLLEDFGEDHDVARQGGGEAGHADVDGVSAGEDGGARRDALGRGDVGAGEADTLSGEGVEVGGVDVRVAVAADVSGAVVIGEDDQHVGGGWGGVNE